MRKSWTRKPDSEPGDHRLNCTTFPNLLPRPRPATASRNWPAILSGAGLGTQGVGLAVNGLPVCPAGRRPTKPGRIHQFNPAVHDTLIQSRIFRADQRFHGGASRAAGGIVCVNVAGHGGVWRLQRRCLRIQQGFGAGLVTRFRTMPTVSGCLISCTSNQFGGAVGGPLLNNKLFFFENTVTLIPGATPATSPWVPTTPAAAQSAPAVPRLLSGSGPVAVRTHR